MGVIEPTPIFDIFCSGVSTVEVLPHGNLRLWCYAQQASGGDGPDEQVLVAKVVIPAAAMPSAISLAMAAIGQKCCKIWAKPHQEAPRALMGLMAATLAVSLMCGNCFRCRIGGDRLLHIDGYGQNTTFITDTHFGKLKRS